MIAFSLELLSLPACVVSALFTENDVAGHHFVVGSVDALDVDGAGAGVDFWAPKLVEDLIAAPFSFFHWSSVVLLVRPCLTQSAFTWPLRTLTLAAT